MLPPTINKHKAVWASSIAIFTLGAVVYFTVYRNSKESSSKPSKKPVQDREIVHKEKKQIDEETSKGRDISNQVDVSQVKATVTLEATDNNQVTSDQQIKVTETEKDASTAETNTMTTAATTTTTTTTTAIETKIDQQKQNYVPSMKSRCNWWPNCTNKNCKYFHPHQPCRYGDLCIYNERCMFLHPWDYEESYK
ncbi:hypothetical protein BJ944DRAFT_43376 [Cunninghamella echinulata]|nr:hypothetical protein BJ944DRAFT_43376 [Cunninghamella echinulata]